MIQLLVQSQLICLLPVGILNLLSLIQLFVSLSLKSLSGEMSIKTRRIKESLLDLVFLLTIVFDDGKEEGVLCGVC